MKLITDAAWFRALKGLRHRSPVAPDAADMGTAFGLDSITIVNMDEDGREPHGLVDAFATPAARDWHRRLARRSRL
jgi:hypothetical protein